MTDIQEKTNKTEKTILLIGASRSGKSTLGNVLIGRNEEVFAEGRYSVSETWKIQCCERIIDGVKYNIIDTPGFLDTSFEIIKIHPALEGLEKLNGIDYVLFTIDTFHTVNVVFFQHLKKFFSSEVVNYTTIVFTKFSNFDKEDSCRTNLERLKCQNESTANIINSVKTIHVDNDPNINENRKKSQKIILDHLTSKKNQNKEKCKISPDLCKTIKDLNEAVLIKKEAEYDVFGKQIEGIRKFIEWRKNMEKEINDHMESLISNIMIAKVVAGVGTIIFLATEANKSADSEEKQEIKVVKFALKFTFAVGVFNISNTLFEGIINKIYNKKILDKIEEDIVQKSQHLTDESIKRIKYDDNFANKLKEELQSNFLCKFENEMKATVDKLLKIVREERKTYCTNPKINTDVANNPDINVTELDESKKMKNRVVGLIYDAKKSHIDKLQEDYILLEEDQNHLRKYHEKLYNERKEIKRKLVEEYNRAKYGRKGAQFTEKKPGRL